MKKNYYYFFLDDFRVQWESHYMTEWNHKMRNDYKIHF